MTSMDFHPSHLTLLTGKTTNKFTIYLSYIRIHSFCLVAMGCIFYYILIYASFSIVGCSNGEISLWEVGMRERLVSQPFKIWDMAACSVSFQVDIVSLTKKS